MSDDIVTRLREYDFMRDGDTPDLTMAAAADEIEDLQAELAECQRQYRTMEADRDGLRRKLHYLVKHAEKLHMKLFWAETPT